jgi:hypothetical protein
MCLAPLLLYPVQLGRFDILKIPARTRHWNWTAFRDQQPEVALLDRLGGGGEFRVAQVGEQLSPTLDFLVPTPTVQVVFDGSQIAHGFHELGIFRAALHQRVGYIQPEFMLILWR